MSFVDRLFHWFTSSANWSGSNGIPELFWRQLELSAVVVVTALIIGGSLGVVLGHTGRGGLVAVNAANAFRAVPTLALLTLLAIQPSISLKWGGFLASWIALTALAIPPILTNTFVGMREVDADVREAAKADRDLARQSVILLSAQGRRFSQATAHRPPRGHHGRVGGAQSGAGHASRHADPATQPRRRA